MIFLLCKFLFRKLTHQQLQWFYNHPLVKSFYSNSHYYELQALRDEINRLQNELTLCENEVPVPVETTPTVVTWSRMDSVAYEYLERQVSNTGVVSSTSEIEAGFKLGVQHVLQKIRSGYVIQNGN